MNEWELAAAYAKGDEQAFATLVRSFFPLVYSAAVRQVGDLQLAEEITQSVFILFARKAPGLSRSVSLPGWLLRTTRFVAKDALKQMNRRLRREQAAAAAQAIAAEGCEPHWAEAAPLVDEALLALPASEQICVVARFFEGRSFREIGASVGLGEDGAQKRVARGLDRIRLFLQRRGVTTSAAALTGLLGVNLTAPAEAQLLQSTLASVQAALAGNTAIRSLAVANRIGRWLAWRHAGLVALPTAVGLLVISGGGWLLQDNLTPAIPPNPAFQLSDSRVANVAHAWSRVVQRAAQLLRQAPQRPRAGDPRVVAYQREVDFIVAETVRVSKELDAIVRQGNDRTLVAEFLTVELTDTLDLGAAQKAAVFALLLQQLGEGPSLLEGMQALVAAKAADAVTIRSWLSARQQRRFDRTYRADGLGLFTFAAAAAASATTK